MTASSRRGPAKRKTLQLIYRNRDFCREVIFRTGKGDGSPTVYANGRLSFDIALKPGRAWHRCLIYDLADGSKRFRTSRECISFNITSDHSRNMDEWQRLIALHAVWKATGDQVMIERHLATAEACLIWIDKYDDRDGDGFQEYQTRSKSGYENMAWKDSRDSVMSLTAPLCVVLKRCVNCRVTPTTLGNAVYCVAQSKRGAQIPKT